MPSVLVRKGAGHDSTVRPPSRCFTPLHTLPAPSTLPVSPSLSLPTIHSPMCAPLYSLLPLPLLYIFDFHTRSLDNPNDPSVQWLKWLEGSFAWEARSLYFVAVGVPAFIIYPPVGLAIAGLGVLVVVAMVRSFHLLPFHLSLSCLPLMVLPSSFLQHPFFHSSSFFPSFDNTFLPSFPFLRVHPLLFHGHSSFLQHFNIPSFLLLKVLHFFLQRPLSFFLLFIAFFPPVL